MLTSYERKLLKYCSKFKEDYVYESSKFEPSFFKSCPQEEIKEICASLKEKGYIDKMSLNLSGDVQFYLSHQGRHYKEVSYLEIKDFLTKSIVTPIIVSLITSLITFFLLS